MYLEAEQGGCRATVRATATARGAGWRGTSGMDDRWLSVDEICTHLGISRDTVYKWIDKKKMPAHRAGRLWKFKRDDVDEWMRTGGASKGNQTARDDVKGNR